MSWAEETAYAKDHRVTCVDRKWWSKINGQQALIEIDGESVWVPVRFEVCPVCGGSGSHVNPSIDCCGLTAEDFHEDPDFLDSYMSGMYNQLCNFCEGRNVVPVCDDKTIEAHLAECIKAREEMRAEMDAERRMGA